MFFYKISFVFWSEPMNGSNYAPPAERSITPAKAQRKNKKKFLPLPQNKKRD